MPREIHKYLTEERAETRFSGEAFPAIKPHLLVLSTYSKSPFYRDSLLVLGICNVN